MVCVLILNSNYISPPYQGGIKGGVLILILDVGYWMWDVGYWMVKI